MSVRVNVIVHPALQRGDNPVKLLLSLSSSKTYAGSIMSPLGVGIRSSPWCVERKKMSLAAVPTTMSMCGCKLFREALLASRTRMSVHPESASVVADGFIKVVGQAAVDW